MAKAIASATWQRALVVLTTTVLGVVVVGALYWAQVVFIPMALAIFLTFLLGPPVLALQRRGLGRVSSVGMVVTLAAVVIALVGWVVGTQVSHLVAGLPKYTENVKKKVKSVQDMAKGDLTDRLDKMYREVTGEVSPGVTEGEEGTSPAASDKAAANRPQRVIIEPESSAWVSRLPHQLGGLLEPLGTLALAVVLSIFMIAKREDLRNRFIRLIGHGRMTVTTKAVDDAAGRISRFLLMQVIINSGYGLAWGIGLRLIGVDYALLWGFTAALARYIPYIGTPLVSLLPVTLALVMFDGWTHVILVVVLLLVLETVTSNVIEPMLYGQSIGVSEVALLLAAAFWAFLWGPIGLVLSGPLTVCLVVLGRYVPQLEFFSVLLSDEPALEPHVAYYQRLLAGDQDEAEQLAWKHAKASPDQVYDELLLPSLTFAKRDRERQLLSDEDEAFVLRVTREIVEDLGERQAAQARETAAADGDPKAVPPKVLALGWPARDEGDRLALEMLAQTLDPARWEMEILSGDMLVAQMVSLVEERQPAIFCIGSLPPVGMAHTRYLCKRLRGRLPHIKIVVGRWGQKGNVEETRERLHEAGADLVETTLLATRNQFTAWLPVLEQKPQAAGDRAPKAVASR